MAELSQRGRLFLGSYAPLFALLAVRFRTPWLWKTCAALAILGTIDMIWIVWGVSRRTGKDPIVVRDIADAGAEVAGYLATYLLPFVTVAEPSTRDLVAYVGFLLVTGLVYTRSEMTQINPTLYILMRRVVKVTTEGDWRGYVIARSSVKAGDTIRTVPLNASVRVEVKKRAG